MSTKKQSKKANVKLVGFLGLGLFVTGLVLSVVGLSKSLSEIDGAVVAGETEAILASAGVKAGENITFPVAYFDQRADDCVNMYDLKAERAAASRQFEWTGCDYTVRQVEQGMVAYELNPKYLPVGVGGSLLSNRGLSDLTRWFDNIGNQSKEYLGKLELAYSLDEKAVFSYANENFYPLDAVGFSDGDWVNRDDHNHLFTMNMAVPFTASANGGESFEIRADDDTFVFVNDKLAVDMGGIHDATVGRFEINELGEVYAGIDGADLAYSGINVKGGESAVVRVFHADRDSANSVFDLKLMGMNINVIRGQIANGNGVQVAYDPSNPGYIAPLGETLSVGPNMTKAYIIIATVMGLLVVICAVFASVMLRALVKAKKR